jgi:hypothetical protein
VCVPHHALRTLLPYHSGQGRQEWVQRQVVSLQQKSDPLPFLKTIPFSGDDDDDGSLARPPMRLFGLVRGQRSFIPDDESGDSADSQFSESGDSDDIESDGGAFGVQWSGSGFGGFTAEEEGDEEL